jgi:hypothetical protein
MKRIRNDSVKPGAGIDGTQGERFTKQGITDHLGMDRTRSDHRERSYSPNAKRSSGDPWVEVGVADAGLRQKDDFGYTASVRDIWSDVNENDGPQGGFSAAIRAGVIGPRGLSADGKKTRPRACPRCRRTS